MAEVFILLGSVPSQPGKVLTIHAEVVIQKGATNDDVLCTGFPSGFVPIAERALKSAKWELVKLGLLSDSALHVLFVNDSNVLWDEFESATLPLALVICVEVHRQIIEDALPYSFAATGRLSNKREVENVKLISQKLSAAIKELGKGDKILFPSDNFSEEMEELTLADEQGINLVPIDTLRAAIEDLLGQLSIPKKLRVFPLILISALALALVYLVTSAFWKENSVIPGVNSPSSIETGRSNKLNSEKSEPLVRLKLRSDLPTSILVDGRLQESDTRGPVEVDVSADSHLVTFAHAQFDTVTFPIFAASEKHSEFICRYLTSITINSQLESGRYQDALVLINDYPFEDTYTPATIQLKPGSYKISVSKVGFEVLEEDSIHLVPKLNKNSKELKFTLRQRE